MRKRSDYFTFNKYFSHLPVYHIKENSVHNMSPDSISPEANAPVWTIPIENVPNDNEDLPTYNHFVTSQIENHPPNYFDISIIPEGAVLHYSEIIPYQEASKAKIQRKPGRVLSIDPLLDKNPDQLWLYFMTYLNEKPCLILTIHGHHMEVKHLENSV